MKIVFSNLDRATVGLYKSLLDDAGIVCFVNNEDIPLPFLPAALCVTNDEDSDRAKELIASYHRAAANGGGEWICPKCQSVVPAGFDSCWQCQADRPKASGATV